MKVAIALRSSGRVGIDNSPVCIISSFSSSHCFAKILPIALRISARRLDAGSAGATTGWKRRKRCVPQDQALDGERTHRSIIFESNHDDLYDNDGDDFGENHGIVKEAEKIPVCLHMCTAWSWF